MSHRRAHGVELNVLQIRLKACAKVKTITISLQYIVASGVMHLKGLIVWFIASTRFRIWPQAKSKQKVLRIHLLFNIEHPSMEQFFRSCILLPYEYCI